MTVQTAVLEGLINAEFGKAERLFRWGGFLQIGLMVASFATIFAHGAALSVMLAMLAALLFIAWATCDWYYRACRGQAERGRRALLIAEGLGGQVSAGELRDVEVDFSVTLEQGRAAHNPNFFASNQPPGNARLLELIEESAFYSCRLYAKSAGVAWRRLAITLLICVALFASSVTVADTDQLMIGSRLLCTILVFLVSQEVLGNGRDYTRAHEILAPVQARIRGLRAAGYPHGDLLILLADYNSAVESAPMMAPGIYKKNAAPLDELWRRHLQTSN